MEELTLDDLLNLPIGTSKRDLTITSVHTKTVGETQRQKLVLTVKEEFTGKTFLISDAYTKSGDKVVIQGLWITLTADKKINPTTTLGRFLAYYKAAGIQSLEGMQIQAYPDAKNYLVAIATDFPDNDYDIQLLLNA